MNEYLLCFVPDDATLIVVICIYFCCIVKSVFSEILDIYNITTTIVVIPLYFDNVGGNEMSEILDIYNITTIFVVIFLFNKKKNTKNIKIYIIYIF